VQDNLYPHKADKIINLLHEIVETLAHVFHIFLKHVQDNQSLSTMSYIIFVGCLMSAMGKTH